MVTNKSSLQAIGSLLFSAVLFALTLYVWLGIDEYEPIKHSVMFDHKHQPVAEQNLSEYATHDNGYRKGKEGVSDFSTHAVLTLFDYNKSEYESSEHRKRFLVFVEGGVIEDFYDKSFKLLSYQKSVLRQDLIVIGSVVGNFEVVKETTQVAYQGDEPYSGPVLTVLARGRVMMETKGDSESRDVYTATLTVQRVLIEEKMSGYQIVNIRMEK